MSRDQFVPGQWNFICDECGRQFKSGVARKTWQGFMVCPRCWDPRHPQDFVRGMQDRESPPWVRPRTDSTPALRTGTRHLAALFMAPIQSRFHPQRTDQPRSALILSGDGFFLYVITLLHFNNVGSSTIIDSSPLANTINNFTGVSPLVQSGVSPLYGAGSAELTYSAGPANYVNWSVPSASGVEWCVEEVLTLSGVYTEHSIFYHGTNLQIQLESTGPYAHRVVGVASGFPKLIGATAVNTGTHHIAVTCTRGVPGFVNTALWVDGVLDATYTGPDSEGWTLNGGTASFNIGILSNGFSAFGGKFDEWRFTLHQRYNAPFTATFPFPDS